MVSGKRWKLEFLLKTGVLAVNSEVSERRYRMQKRPAFFSMATGFVLAFSLGAICPSSNAQIAPAIFEIDPSWPKPLPNLWVTGGIGGVCIDAHDHVFVLNRRDLTDNELDAAHQAPPVIEFSPEGNVVNSFGDPNVVPDHLHGCTVDGEDNVWLTGSEDGIVQKYSHDGKLLLQIGKKGIVDSSDGTLTGKALNSSHTRFSSPRPLRLIRAMVIFTLPMARIPVATTA